MSGKKEKAIAVMAEWLRDGEPDRDDCGLCLNILCLDEDVGLDKKLFKAFKEFIGEEVYPVEGSSQEYRDNRQNNCLYSGDAGQKRLKLLRDFMEHIKEYGFA